MRTQTLIVENSERVLGKLKFYPEYEFIAVLDSCTPMITKIAEQGLYLWTKNPNSVQALRTHIPNTSNQLLPTYMKYLEERYPLLKLTLITEV